MTSAQGSASPERIATRLDVKAGNTTFKKRWCLLDVDHISWGKDPDKPKHKVLLSSNLKVELTDSVLVVTDPSAPVAEQLCVSVSEADTTSVSVLQEWRKRWEESASVGSSVAEAVPRLDEEANQSPQIERERSVVPSVSTENSTVTGTLTPGPSPSRFSPRLTGRKKVSQAAAAQASAFTSATTPGTDLSPEDGINPPKKVSPERRAQVVQALNQAAQWRRQERQEWILPAEILLKVLRFIPWTDILLHVASVSREWLNLTRTDTLWKSLYRLNYGTLYDGSTLFTDRSTWPEKFYTMKLVEDNWMAGKYKKKETLYVSLRTVRKLLWSQKSLGLVYGNTVDFMDAEKRRIFSRFSPEAPYIRGIDICDDIIACSTKEKWNHVLLQKRSENMNAMPNSNEITSWRAGDEIIDVVAFPNYCHQHPHLHKAPTKLMTGARICIMWDLETQKPIMAIGAQNQGSVNTLKFDDNKVICSHRGSKLRIWDTRSGKRTFVMKGHNNLIHSFSYNDDALVSGSKDCTLRVWDPRKGFECRSVLAGHKTSVRDLEMSDFRVVSGSKDEVRIWDIRNSEKEVKASCRIPLHDPTFSLTFDDTHLYIGSATLRVFDFSEKRSRMKNFLKKTIRF